VRCETSAVSPSGEGLRAGLAESDPPDTSLATAALRVAALARLTQIGFGQMRRSLEEAVAVLRAMPGGDGVESQAKVTAALDAYQAAGERFLRDGV
jgi:hypothetical protein